jgi:uridine monophosphate synthetase
MTPEEFHQFILTHGIIGFFDEPLTLKSGRQSHFYVNWRSACADAFLLDQLTDAIAAFLQQTGWSFDCLYGVPEGATKPAVIAGLKLARQRPDWQPGQTIIPMGRAKPKEHGNPADRFFIGAPSGRVVVLEDTITTGLSLIQTLDQLLDQNIQVIGALSLTDRMEKRDDGLSVAAAIEQRYQGRIAYRTMSQATDLLAAAIDRQNATPELRQAITEEFERYGTQPLILSDQS